MEEAVAPENYGKALRAVTRNDGAPGIDRMSAAELEKHLDIHWEKIRAKLRNGTYVPAPVRRVEIPKPSGGTPMLGIPTVVDRFIQQLLLQVLTPIFEPMFSNHSYGFRPGRTTAMGFDREDAWPTLCEPRRNSLARGKTGWSIWTLPSSWIRLHTAPWLMKIIRTTRVADLPL